LREKIGARLIVAPGAGHLNAGDGFTELPIVLKAVLEIAGEKL